uniref:Beta-1,4-N-acetyl-galactosaminyl transferase 2 n=1 Tax=Jaculus jaculus TaxID=51337 RepID=A0A8C5K3A3_JACJA
FFSAAGLCVVLFILKSVYLQAKFDSFKPEPSRPPLVLKLLPEVQLRNLFTYNGIWLFPKNQCDCDSMHLRRRYNFQDAYDPAELQAVKGEHQNLGVLSCGMFLSFSLCPPGLQYEGPDAPVYEVTLRASLGILNTLADIPDNVVQGRGQKQLTILTSDRKLLKFVLAHVTYTSKVYQHNKVDTVSLEYKSSVAKFPVTIRHPAIPRLHDPGPGKVAIALTAETSLTVIELTLWHPQGWFAGRNLAISQVTTKYVLWVDDDFLFTNKTKIEVLVDVLEKTELDVVGGSVLGNVYQFKLLLEQSKNGDCLHQRSGGFQLLDGFPNCVVTSGVVNFFLAHTERLLRVGFDPRLQRVAHLEFFVDGLGTLLVGSCPEVIIGHQPHTPVTDSEWATLEKSYSKYRTNTNAQIQYKLALHYFKNHLQCST